MLSPAEQERYSRQIMLPQIGEDGQQKLKAAKVLMVGAGGLGCPVLQYLAAAGVGHIGIVDGDVVSLSNLQRQILYTEADIDKPKAETAAEKIRLLNPHIDIVSYNTELNNENAIEIIQPYDIVVDGSDNFATRYLLNDACVITNKPLVFGSIDKFEGQVSVFNYNNGPTYRCLFPDMPPAEMMPNCSEIGVIATLPAIVGSIQANEVLKIITAAGNVLSGTLLMFNALSMQFHQFHFSLNEKNRDIYQLQQSQKKVCAAPQIIAYSHLQELLQQEKDVQLIDIREESDHARFNIGGINIPYYEIQTRVSELDPNKKTVLYCQVGQMSKQWATWLMQQGFQDVFSLKDGVVSAR
ncbi:HesA/MoeB/ThiF family protein [Taibaiella soli]|uniref:Molybdopterin-synthase adenylyltransferase n=1 Tax=Taibaiella soli TaxID=1649169 RepID=A0A2W2B5J1_9BACT|nr:HesA/MoeB/ThiF family protein [Taibaiella soli]PZF71469.1 dinucleotide-utilizing protein [Taibaiella soli]